MTTRTGLATIVALGLVVGLAGLAPAAGIDDFKRAWTEAQDDPVSQREALKYLAEDGSSKAFVLLMNVAKSDQVHYTVSNEAEKLFGLTPEALSWLARRLNKANDARERAIIAQALAAHHPDTEARDALIGALNDKRWGVQAQAVQSLANWRDKEVVDALVELAQKLEKDSGRVYSDALSVLERLTGHKLRDGSAWASWWSAKRANFEFGDVKPTAGNAGGTELRGGQLYDEIESKQVIFIVDVSGSMRVVAGGGDFQRRSRLEHMKVELRRVLDAELQTGANFNIVAFSDSVNALFSKLTKKSSSSAGRANAYVTQLTADGGTNSYGALVHAFRDKNVDTIYFLSDGTPTSGEKIDPDEILGEIRKLNRGRSIQVNTIAFLAGDGEPIGVVENKESSRKFMKELAAICDGEYRLVE